MTGQHRDSRYCIRDHEPDQTGTDVAAHTAPESVLSNREVLRLPNEGNPGRLLINPAILPGVVSNRAVQRLLAVGLNTAEPGTTVSSPGDSAELEADRIARRLVAEPGPAISNLQLAPDGVPPGPDHDLIRIQPTSTGGVAAENDGLASNIASATGGGHGLPASTRDFFPAAARPRLQRRESAHRSAGRRDQ